MTKDRPFEPDRPAQPRPEPPPSREQPDPGVIPARPVILDPGTRWEVPTNDPLWPDRDPPEVKIEP
jgi:hypothetical protein